MRDGKCSLLRDCFHLEVQSSWSAMSTSWHDVTLNDSTHACMWIDTNATHKNSAMLVANFMFKKLIKERIWRWYPYWNCISDSINDHTSMPHSHQNKNRYMSSFHHSSTMALGLPVYNQFTFIFHRRPSCYIFLSCRPFVAITTLSTGFVGVEVTSVSWLEQLTVGV